MKTTSQDGLKIGVGWYTPASYAALLEVAADRDDLPATFDEWLKQARKLIFILRGEGMQPEQIFVDIDELVSWCGRRGVPLNGRNRADFVSEKTLGTAARGPLKL